MRPNRRSKKLRGVIFDGSRSIIWYFVLKSSVYYLLTPRMHLQVEFVCGKNERIVSIKEDHTCHYTLVFATPHLCNHPLFVDKVGSISLSVTHALLCYSWYLNPVLIQPFYVQCRVAVGDNPRSSMQKGKGRWLNVCFFILQDQHQHSCHKIVVSWTFVNILVKYAKN